MRREINLKGNKLTVITYGVPNYMKKTSVQREATKAAMAWFVRNKIPVKRWAVLRNKLDKDGNYITTYRVTVMKRR